MFTLRLIFPSSQILTNANVSAHNYQCSHSGSYSLHSDRRKYHGLPSGSFSLILAEPQTLANTGVCAQAQIPAFALRHLQILVSALTNTSARAQAHIPLLSDMREFQCSRSQIPALALRLIFLCTQIVANSAQAHVPLLSDRCKFQCLLSNTCRYQCLLSALYSSQIVANNNVCTQPHIPVSSDTLKYQCSR
jgi:hypothetical protein